MYNAVYRGEVAAGGIMNWNIESTSPEQQPTRRSLPLGPHSPFGGFLDVVHWNTYPAYAGTRHENQVSLVAGAYSQDPARARAMGEAIVRHWPAFAAAVAADLEAIND